MPYDIDAETQARIDAYGYTFIGVFDPDGGAPSFVYTIGLTNRGWPELLLIGNMAPQIAQALIGQVIEYWTAHNGPVQGLIHDQITFPDGSSHPLLVQPVDTQHAQARYACRVRRHCKSPIQVWQLMWPDTNGLFPGQPGYDATMIQPVLPV